MAAADPHDRTEPMSASKDRRSVLVTGAATGFGRGVALGLARRGHRVWAGCQIWPQVWELRQVAATEGLEIEVIKLDVLNEIDRTKAFDLDVDVLFNNAGIMESGPMVEIPLTVVRSVFETNVFAALELAQGFGRKMVRRGAGRIVWTSSVAGLVKVPFDGAYAASKHAVEGICSALREAMRCFASSAAALALGMVAASESICPCSSTTLCCMPRYSSLEKLLRCTRA